MSSARLSRRTAAVFAALALAGSLVGLAPAAAADERVPVRVIKYDISKAGKYADAVRQGAEAWNRHIPTIKLEEGSPADFTATAAGGWPHAVPQGGFGRGRIVMGEDALDTGRGFYPPRVAMHEIGHLFGLPDNRTGRCADLMAGSSSPVSCKSVDPSPSELAKVKQNAGGGRMLLPAGVPIVD